MKRSALFRLCMSLLLAGLSLAAATAPSITTQPANQVVIIGSKATFTVVASGTATLTYQWSRNGTTLSGATSASYTTPAAVSTDSGSTFTVTVTNSAGTKTSTAASLTVNSPPTITTQPASKSVAIGSTATFSVVASGIGTLSYQWSKKGVAISGATSASYTTPAVVAGDTGATFAVKVTSSYGGTTATTPSSNATLTIAPPTLSGFTPSSAEEKTLVTLTGTNLTGATAVKFNGSTASFTVVNATSITANAPAGVTTGPISVTTPGGTATSSTSFTAIPSVSVTVTPTTSTVAGGSSLVLSAKVLGSTNTAVTWSVVGGSINGWVNTSGLYFAPASAGTYSVLATSSADSRKSAVATVVVQNATPLQVTLTPLEVIVAPGEDTFIQARCSGSSSDVAFKPTCPAGTIADYGGGYFGYTAPSAVGDYVITVKAGSTKAQACALVHVQTPPAGVSLVINPQNPVLTIGGGVNLSASVNGANDPSVSWSVVGGDVNGTIIDASYSPPSSAGIYTVIATSVEDKTKSAQTQIYVLPRVDLLGESAIFQGEWGQFSATVAGIEDQEIIWSATAGTIQQDGNFKAPASAGTVVITAASKADPRGKASFWVNVPAIRVSLNPGATVSTPAGVAVSLSAVVNGASNPGVTWSLLSGAGSLVANATNNGATFLPPYAPGVAVIQAASAAFPSITATVTITIVENPAPVIRSFTVSPSNVTLGGTAVLQGDFGPGSGIVTPGGLSLDAGQTLSITPASSTRYTLSLSKAGDPPVTAMASVDAGVWDPGVFSEVISYPAGVFPSTAMLARDGKVYLMAYRQEDANSLYCYVFDPATGAFSALPGSIPGLRYEFTSVLLQDGRIWIQGGYTSTFNGSYTYDNLENGTWLYDPTTGATQAGPSLAPSYCQMLANAIRLLDGRVLVTGGLGLPSGVTSCWGNSCSEPKNWAWIFDPVSSAYATLPGGMSTTRIQHTSQLLPDGRVLLIGGMGSHSMELFDPATETFQPAPSGVLGSVTRTSDGRPCKTLEV